MHFLNGAHAPTPLRHPLRRERERERGRGESRGEGVEKLL